MNWSFLNTTDVASSGPALHPRTPCLTELWVIPTVSRFPIEANNGFQVATAPWARSLGRSASRISSRRFLVQRFPRTTSSFQYASRRLISSTVSETSAISHHAGFSFTDSNTSSTEKKTPQTLTEKIVQSHAVGLPEDKVARSGDYIMIKVSANLFAWFSKP